MGGVRAQGHLKQILNAMLAEVFPCKEVLVPMANQKVVDGLLADAAILDFADENLSAFIARLEHPGAS
jgi:chromate reductase